MSKKICVDVVEQCAIFDGEPEFSVPLHAIVNLLNFHSLGGTPSDMEEALKDRSIDDPKRYRVTLKLDYEEL